MKIVSIFAGKLFAFHYDGEEENELKRILALWQDAGYLYSFVSRNISDLHNKSIPLVVAQLQADAEAIDEQLEYCCCTEMGNLDTFFKQLHNSEYQFKTLSQQKGRKNYLRLYAIKIDSNCFVITGGAIKFTLLMSDREHTQLEKDKLDRAKQFLQANGIFDANSFFEFLIELQ